MERSVKELREEYFAEQKKKDDAAQLEKEKMFKTLIREAVQAGRIVDVPNQDGRYQMLDPQAVQEIYKQMEQYADGVSKSKIKKRAMYFIAAAKRKKK